MVATGVIAARLAPRLGFIAGALAALLVALHPGVLFWTASGMETMLFTALLLLGVAVGTVGRNPVLAGLLCGLTALTRLEGVVFGIGVGLILLARGDRSALKRFAPGILVPLLIYEIFRLAYYGTPLPNVFYTKAGFQIEHGLWYLWQFIRNGGFVFALALVALAGKERQVAACWLFFVGTYLAWVVAIGGDFYAFHRFITPVVPLLAILVAVAAEALLPSNRRRAAVLLVLGVTLWVGSMVDVYRYAKSAADGMRAFVARRGTIGESIRDHAPPGTTVAAVAMGAFSYYAGPDIRVIDMLGLNDAYIARHGIHVPDGLPGHSRYDNEYVLEQRPDLVVIQINPSSTHLRPMTAATVRNDPENLRLYAWVAVETGIYAPVDLKKGPPELHYALHAQLDFISPEHQAQLAPEYRLITELPGNVRVHVYQRRGWSFSRGGQVVH